MALQVDPILDGKQEAIKFLWLSFEGGRFSEPNGWSTSSSSGRDSGCKGIKCIIKLFLAHGKAIGDSRELGKRAEDEVYSIVRGI